MGNIVDKLRILGLNPEKLNSWAYKFKSDKEGYYNICNIKRNRFYKLEVYHTVAVESAVLCWRYTNNTNVDSEIIIIRKDGKQIIIGDRYEVAGFTSPDLTFTKSHTILLLKSYTEYSLSDIDITIYDVDTEDKITFRIYNAGTGVFNLSPLDKEMCIYALDMNNNHSRLLISFDNKNITKFKIHSDYIELRR